MILAASEPLQWTELSWNKLVPVRDGLCGWGNNLCSLETVKRNDIIM